MTRFFCWPLVTLAWAAPVCAHAQVEQAVLSHVSYDLRDSIDVGGSLDLTAVSFQQAVQPEAPTPTPGGSFDMTATQEQPFSGQPVYGPPVDSDPVQMPGENRYRSFGEKFDAVKWEVGGIFAYTTAVQLLGSDELRSFRFQDEGWFGRDTGSLGLDKLSHAHNTYLVTELLHWRLTRKTGGVSGDALAAGALAFGLQLYGELWDGHKTTSGFSYQDALFNAGGALFSMLRNTTPGMREKVDFRLMIIPNSDIYSAKGQRHWRQQRYILAATLSGFDGLQESPLRFLELHAGYYATGFTDAELARGESPRRRPYFGIGFNFKELFFKNPRSLPARAGAAILDYWQLPYTSLQVVR